MSSAGYADRLKPYDNKGVCGLPESCDSRRVLDKKTTTKLVRLMMAVKPPVAQVYTQRWGCAGNDVRS